MPFHYHLLVGVGGEMFVSPRGLARSWQSAHHDHFAVLFGSGGFGPTNERTDIHLSDESISRQRMITGFRLTKIDFQILVLGQDVREKRLACIRMR